MQQQRTLTSPLPRALATGRATDQGDHDAVTEITAAIGHAAARRRDGKVAKLIGFKALLLKLSASQRATVSAEIFDVGTDGAAYVSILTLLHNNSCNDDISTLATTQLVVFVIALLMQGVRWQVAARSSQP